MLPNTYSPVWPRKSGTAVRPAGRLVIPISKVSGTQRFGMAFLLPVYAQCQIRSRFIKIERRLFVHSLTPAAGGVYG